MDDDNLMSLQVQNIPPQIGYRPFPGVLCVRKPFAGYCWRIPFDAAALCLNDRRLLVYFPDGNSNINGRQD